MRFAGIELGLQAQQALTFGLAEVKKRRPDQWANVRDAVTLADMLFKVNPDALMLLFSCFFFVFFCSTWLKDWPND